MNRTRIKICGITRADDATAAVRAGADAIGLVAYPQSPRFVTAAAAAELARQLPPFVTPVLLLVNADRAHAASYIDQFRGYTLQFHGDESAADCEHFAHPYIKAARVAADGRVSGIGFADYCARFGSAQAILADADSAGFGGAGHTFDWAAIPASLPLPLILSGGLDASNVGAGIAATRPWAVDVSSGVEKSKGVKDAGKIQAFTDAVFAADLSLRSHHE